MTTPARETQGEGRVLALPLYADHDGAEHIEGTNLALTDIFDANGHCVAETYGRETADALVVAANSIASLAESLAARDARIAELEAERTQAAQDALLCMSKVAAERDALTAECDRLVQQLADARSYILADEERRKLTGDALQAEAERDHLAQQLTQSLARIQIIATGGTPDSDADPTEAERAVAALRESLTASREKVAQLTVAIEGNAVALDLIVRCLRDGRAPLAGVPS